MVQRVIAFQHWSALKLDGIREKRGDCGVIVAWEYWNTRTQWLNVWWKQKTILYPCYQTLFFYSFLSISFFFRYTNVFHLLGFFLRFIHGGKGYFLVNEYHQNYDTNMLKIGNPENEPSSQNTYIWKNKSKTCMREYRE